METYYKGTEIKFNIDIKAEGFDMDIDDFDVAVVSGNTRIEGDKWNSRAAAMANSDSSEERQRRMELLVFRDPPLPDSSDSDTDGSSSDSSEEEESHWFAIANTEYLAVGDMKVIGTCYIPDGYADDLIRRDIDVTTLGRLVNP